ncbi:peptidase [Nocardioides anomalus]|uniref:Peptidase n=1 Tax=Nocardioides anomalus TaxID=2712223 RepID=A0A6G6WJR3_9ACTN|nr:peptidase [Nocardioides anomalus]QIG45446.1 peptidase [Nocardioides anomalus]
MHDTRGEAGQARHRLVWAVVLAGALIAGALALPSYAGQGGGRTGSMQSIQNQQKQQALGKVMKNQISRGLALGEEGDDPATVLTKLSGTAAVALQREMKDPELRKVPVMQKRLRTPQDRYAMANGCYRVAGQPVFFKPTDLGQYLLYTAGARFLVPDGTADKPSDATVWTAQQVGRKKPRFTFTNASGRLTLGGTSTFRLQRTTGCTAYPEAGVDISGRPAAGVTKYQEVRGYVDAHTHGMAFEFLGGDAHCGKPWDRFGAPYALVDCVDHTLTGGFGGVLEDALSGKAHHDPVGWPTFKDWPAPESLTHEGTYWKWLERSWRGGQRIFVNLLVENNQLCNLYPIKRNSCDDMTSIRLQAQDMYKLQDYIDAQFGGPGKGFYRIVTNPFQARKVINAGKMAVIMGIETSVPFGCSVKLGTPTCDAADIDRQLDEVHAMGVRQMELVNKFDNALSGVAGDEGAVGPLVNAANLLETGSFWDMRHCDPADGESHDRNQTGNPAIDPEQQDALFGAVAQLGLPTIAVPPLYPAPNHCNARGLTTLGEHTIQGLADRHMVFDPDHMSVKARSTALDYIDRIGYPGVVSSHSWATPDAYPRIYGEGGFITPYAGDSTGFVDKWRRHVGWADPRYYWGIGYGADMNGLGAQGDPRGAAVANPVTYPFKGLNGVTVNKQTAGQRTWDINVDGVAQYGLYPDWIQDLTKVAGADGDALLEDIERGPEAYLQMWERAEGIAPDSCRNPELRKSVRKVGKLIEPGMSTRAVMAAVGQPYTRLGSTYGFCATEGKKNVRIKVRFTPGGKVVALRRAR